MVASVGSSATAQLLSSLLAKLSSASSVSSGSASSSTTTATVSAFQQALPGDTQKSLAPPPTPTLSGDILTALMALQAQTGNSAQAGTSGDSASPVQQLFSAMDTDSDGEVSQGEMESYIEKQGGTQTQADALFNSLDQGDSNGGISEADMQGAVTNARQAFQAHHHHHRHGMGGGNPSADNVASTLLQAMDSNDDGAVSEDEFSDFVTANGGTAAQAQTEFAQLDQSGSGALTSADFAKAFNAYQAQQTAQSSGSMMLSMLNRLSNAAGTLSA